MQQDQHDLAQLAAAPGPRPASLWSRARTGLRQIFASPEDKIAPIRLKARFNHFAGYETGSGPALVPAAHPDHPGLADCVTPRNALRLFDYFNDLGYIAYNYTENGCFARAHLLCREIADLSQNRILPLKIWADGSNPHGRLSPLMPENFPFDIEWSYHVAAGVHVLDAQGRIFPVVFDPSLFDGPVTAEEWRDALCAFPEQIDITYFGHSSPKGHLGGYHFFAEAPPPKNPDTEALEMMRRYKKREPIAPLSKLPSQFRLSHAG